MENNTWKEYKIKEIAEVIGGGTPKTDNPNFWNGYIPWITPRDLTGYSKMYISKGERMISNEGLKGSSARLLPKGTVLLTSRAPIGYVAIAENEICTNQGFKSLVINKELTNSKFIYYWIKNNVEYLQSIGTGTTFAEISGNVIKEIDIKLPPLPEQKAIASVLSSLDDKIDLLHQQNQTLEALAETLFRQWFIERRPEHAEGEAKEDWEEGKLEQLVLSANTGLDAIRRAPIVENYTGIKCLRIQDISQNKTYDNWGNTEVKDSDYVKAQLKRGDIIMARTCSPGILLHVQEDLNAVFNNGLARIRANENSHPIFLKYLFKTNEFTNHIYGISDGTAVQLNMKLGDLLSYDLKIPPKNFIDRFVEIVSEWNDKILANQQQIQTLTKLRDTLLPKLMSGEVRVKV